MLPSLSLLLILSFSPASDVKADRDADGLTDAQEQILGTDPAAADRWQTVYEAPPESEARRKQATYDATKDFTRVECAHIGGNRYLWRVTFAAPPRLEDTVLHLYVDADANLETGRKGTAQSTSTGTDYMLSVVGGRGTSQRYEPDGSHHPGPQVRHCVDGNQVLISADVDLARNERGARFGLYVLCHTITAAKEKVPMSKSSRRVTVEGLALVNRPKIVRPEDHDTNYRVLASFGEPMLHRLLADPGTIEVRHDQLQVDGFEIDLQTSHRWPHLAAKKSGATAWTTAPKAGRYHVGFMLYDDGNDDRVAISIDSKLAGVAVAKADNNRTWVYWLADPFSFRGGERIELKAVGPSGRHPVVNLLLIPNPPRPRTVEAKIENLIVAPQLDPLRGGGRIVSWTTTWPCPTRFEYGQGEKRQKIEEENRCLVHRVVLTGLDPKAVYRGRAFATAPDGKIIAGEEVDLAVKLPELKPLSGKTFCVPLAVRNPTSAQLRQSAVTSGIPVPRGQLADVENLHVFDPEGTAIPLQRQLLARWPDASVKWVLLTFLADVPANGQAVYECRTSDSRKSNVAPALVCAARTSGRAVTIDTGRLRFDVDPSGCLRNFQGDGKTVLAGPFDCVATDAQGRQYRLAPGGAAPVIEEAGPIRVVVKTVGHLQSRSDRVARPLLRVEQRVIASAGSAAVRLEHTLVFDHPGEFTEFKRLALQLPLQGNEPWQCADAAGRTLTLRPGTQLAQFFDDQLLRKSGSQIDSEKGRIAGSLTSAAGRAPAVVVRDFWQNYPKAFALDSNALSIELCPEFPAGQYDKFPFEKEGHHLYYYLQGARYKIKRGVAKTHEIGLVFEPDVAACRQACALIQQPLLATAAPQWYCGSKAFYDVAPRNPQRFKLYEEAIDKNLAAYVKARDRTRDYGMLNFGDWYPERGANWGNIEYDTQHAFFLEYIRSGNPEAFYLGDQTERHNRDVDTIHAADSPETLGGVYVHQMGHVGGYYKEGVPGTLGIPHAGFSVSHAWAEGHFDHYFLTGDRRSYETGCAVSDYFTRHELSRPYDFLSCRVPGWHLIMLAAAYAATSDPYYLNAARVVVDRVLETQDRLPRPLPPYQAEGRKPFQLGGWSRMMVPGHCLCEPRHRGNAGFMVAVLLAGLKYYHDVTGDPRVKEAIILGAHSLVEETYSDEVKGFRYTSCPKGRYVPGASPLMVEGIARAYLWTHDERFRRVLTEALPLGGRGSPYGKSFSMYYRMAPRVLADLEAAGLELK